MNVLGHAASHNLPEPAEVPRHIPTTLEAWRDNRTGIEQALRDSNDELRTICGSLGERASFSPHPEPNAHGKLSSHGADELAEVPRQIAMLEAWQARRDRLREALRHSDHELLALLKRACRSRLDPTLRAA